MKKLLLISALLIFACSYGQVNEKAFIKNSILLKDSEKIDLNLILTSLIKQTKLIVDKDSSEELKSDALMRAFSTKDYNITDIVSYINRVSEGRNLGYWNTLVENEMQFRPYYKTVYGKRLYTSFEKAKVNYITDPNYLFENTELFYRFFSKLFNSKTVRGILFKTGLNIVLNICENYPKDFTKHIISELNVLLEYCDSINKIPASKLEKMDFDNNYWKGFIARRIIYNNLSVKEIKNLIISAIVRLNAIDLYKLPDVYYSLTINDNISVSFDKSFYYLNSLSSGKRITIDYYNEPHTIKYFEDKNNSLYVFKFRDKKGRWVENIYDINLNMIN